MKVVNFNDEFRCAIINVTDSPDKIKELYDFCFNNDTYLEYVLGLVFFSAYVYAYDARKKEEMTPDNDDLFGEFDDEDYSLIVDYGNEFDDEDYSLIVDYGNEFDNVTELFIDVDTFLYYFSFFEEFSNYSKSIKSEVVRTSLEKSDFLIKMFPAAINDYLYYCNDYDPDDIVDDYNDKLSYFKDDKEAALKSCLNYYLEVFDKLKNDDIYKFEYLVLEMFETYYKYNKYLLWAGKKADSFAPELISLADESVTYVIFSALKNKNIIAELIRSFITYSALSSEEKKKVNNYYQDEQNALRLSEVAGQCKRLKKEDNGPKK